MEELLKLEANRIDVLYSHNDDMAIGAIKAIEEYGLKPGKDIIIVSVDAIRGAFEKMIEGKLNCTVECNPLLGPQLMRVVKDLVMSKEIPKRIYVEESVFPEEVLEEIRSVSSLVEEDIQQFILYEVESCETVKKQIQENVNRWAVTNIVVLFLVLMISIGAALFISGSISNPIMELREMAASIAAGNLNVRVKSKNSDEIASLGTSLNTMAGELKELMEKSIKEQENLKKSELKALQIQINPHFLYNTLDTIVWMAEANKSEQVIEIVRALSNFCRITLS